jgi:AraC family L-rhamnose operon regulatory protein RhaS
MEYITVPKDPANPFFLKLSVGEIAPAAMVPETPDRFRLVLVRSGALGARWNGSEFLVTAPALLCLNETDRLVLQGEKPAPVTVCWFHPDLVNDAFDLVNIRNDPRQFSGIAIHDCYLFTPFLAKDPVGRILDPDRPLFDRIRELVINLADTAGEQSDPFWLCQCRSLFIQLLYLVHKAAPSGTTTRFIPTELGGIDDPLVRDVLIHLHGLLDTRITIEDLSVRFATNRTTLSNRFKKATGETLIGYLLQIRLQAAARLLRNTDLCPVYIQELAGFHDTSWFHRKFRALFGMSPGVYREKMMIRR